MLHSKRWTDSDSQWAPAVWTEAKERPGVTKDGNSRAAARLNTVDETRTNEHSFDALPQFPCIHRFQQRPNLSSVIRTLLQFLLLLFFGFVYGVFRRRFPHTHTEHLFPVGTKHTAGPPDWYTINPTRKWIRLLKQSNLKDVDFIGVPTLNRNEGFPTTLNMAPAT